MKHCVKSVLIQSYSGPHFPAFGLNISEYTLNISELLSSSPYSVQMRENTDQNNSEYSRFLHSETFQNFIEKNGKFPKILDKDFGGNRLITKNQEQFD